MDKNNRLHHEDLDVYQAAIKFVALVPPPRLEPSPRSASCRSSWGKRVGAEMGVRGDGDGDGKGDGNGNGDGKGNRRVELLFSVRADSDGIRRTLWVGSEAWTADPTVRPGVRVWRTTPTSCRRSCSRW
jgi:hypothetical protein